MPTLGWIIQWAFRICLGSVPGPPQIVNSVDNEIHNWRTQNTSRCNQKRLAWTRSNFQSGLKVPWSPPAADVIICKIQYPGGGESWNRFPMNTKGPLYNPFWAHLGCVLDAVAMFPKHVHHCWISWISSFPWFHGWAQGKTGPVGRIWKRTTLIDWWMWFAVPAFPPLRSPAFYNF